MTSKTPQAVLDALEKLDGADRETVQNYISELQKNLKDEFKVEEEDYVMPDVEDTKTAEEEPAAAAPAADSADGDDGDEAAAADDDDDAAANEENEADFPPIYEGPAEDFEKAADCKQQAADAKGAADWETALGHYTAAILAAPPSALLYANRAHALLKLGRPKAAERDCTLALKENPDSAKAMRIRGKARKELGQWEAALKDLSASQTIDFDEGTVEDLKFLSEKHLEMEKNAAEKRNLEEEKKRKRAEEIRKAQEEAKREAEEEKARASAAGGGGMPGGFPGGFPGGMPGGMGGMPGGMPGGGGMDMGGMMGMMNDPEIREGLQNPKVQAAMAEMMGGGGMPDPAKMQKMMSDPEVGPIMQKIMSKLGAGMGGGAPPPANNDDGIPDMDDMGDDGVDLDDLPDLE